MDARVTKVARVRARFSKRLARGRFRPNEGKLRSTIAMRSRGRGELSAEIAEIADRDARTRGAKRFASNLNCGLRENRLFWGGDVERKRVECGVVAILARDVAA